MRNDSDVKTARRPPGDEAENVQSVNIPSVAKSDGSIKPRGAVVRRDRPNVLAIVQGHKEAEELSRQHDAPTRPTTDLGNAERLRDQFGEVIRFDHSLGKWRYWDGTRWCADATGTVHHLAKIVIRRIHNEARDSGSDQERKELGRWAVKSEGVHGFRNMLTLAESDPALATVTNDYDTDRDVLNTESGIVDLRTGALLTHDPAQMHSKIAPTAYRPELLQRESDDMPRYVAEAPLFSKFVTEITVGRRDLMLWLQTYLGYGITGHANEQLLAIFTGGGSNGKGTLLHLVGRVVGDYFQSAPPSLIVDDAKSGSGPTPEVARLAGIRLLEIEETKDGDKLHESRVKWLTGEDTLVARHLHREYFEFSPQFSPILVTNSLPRVSTGSHAMWRRLRAAPFEYTAEEETKDRDLGDKLYQEREAVLAWLVEGAVRWYAAGIPKSETVERASAGYRKEEDAIGPFLEDRTEKGGLVKRSDLYKAYQRWCETEGETPMYVRRFHSAMRERGYREVMDRIYGGLRLQEVNAWQ